MYESTTNPCRSSGSSLSLPTCMEKRKLKVRLNPSIGSKIYVRPPPTGMGTIAVGSFQDQRPLDQGGVHPRSHLTGIGLLASDGDLFWGARE